MSDVAVKPGNETSEFKIEWLSTIVAIATAIIPVVMQAIGEGHWMYVALSCVLAAVIKLGSMGYSKSRAIVKASAVNPTATPG